MWIAPIFDRSGSDIVNKTSKAFRNVSDINRIEGNTEHLALILNLPLQTKQWSANQFPSGSEYRRMLENINAVKQKAGFIGIPVPELPLNTFLKMNDAEQILYEAYAAFVRQSQLTIYAGEAFAGDRGVI